jgi:hypothetical protein
MCVKESVVFVLCVRVCVYVCVCVCVCARACMCACVDRNEKTDVEPTFTNPQEMRLPRTS